MSSRLQYLVRFARQFTFILRKIDSKSTQEMSDQDIENELLRQIQDIEDVRSLISLQAIFLGLSIDESYFACRRVKIKFNGISELEYPKTSCATICPLYASFKKNYEATKASLCELAKSFYDKSEAELIYTNLLPANYEQFEIVTSKRITEIENRISSYIQIHIDSKLTTTSF